ncbi:MAG: HDIG domain-containing metalloprotein, partial [Patescibacteria group bacterium]
MKNVESFKNIELAEYPVELRNLVENYALEILSHGRPGWDVPHTLAVVKWANKLARVQGLDVRVLTTAAYLHDIGYYGQFGGLESADLGKVMDKKEKHMIIGAAMAASFLDSEDVRKYLTADQIERVIHLISVHDRVEYLSDLDELVLMEADHLGAI